MTQSGYHTVFEIGLHSFPWSIALVPTLLIVIGLGLVRFSRGKQIRQAVGGGAVIFSLFFFLLTCVAVVPEFFKEWHAYARGQFSTVEGTVENFHPRPGLGPADESFSVKGISFTYNALDYTSCFHNAGLHGIIRSGLDVRIFYSNECIFRVDVRQ